MEISYLPTKSGLMRSHELYLVETTLYDLMEAVMDELKPGEEYLMTEIIMDMLKTWRMGL